MLGLRLCVRAFSCCGKWGATLHRGVRASHRHGLSCCGAQAPDSTHFKSSKTPDKCLCSPPRPGESVPSVRDTWKAEWTSACGLLPGARVCEFLRRALNFCSFCWLDRVVGKWWRVPCIQDMIVVTNNHFVLSVHVCVLIFSFYKDPSHIGLEPTHLPSFDLSYLFKGLISKYSHITRYWGLRLPHINVSRTQFSWW